MSTLKANNDDPTLSASVDLQPAEDDDYYMHCMAEILDSTPKTAPPDHPTRLSEHLYIGNQDNADDAQLLTALDITHVLNMAGTRTFDLTRSPYKPDSGIRSFLMMPTEDFEDFDILPNVLEAIAFLSRAETSGGCAFVHCNYGINRSGVVAAAYLMVSERKPLLQVVNELKARRSVILTNVGFRRQLVRFGRCRGLLDPVERPTRRRSPRLEPGQGTPRGVSPCNEEPNEIGDLTTKETAGKNGAEIPPPARNGYHITAPVVTMHLNGIPSNGLRPRPGTSRRDRLLRDIDSTIETLSLHDGADTASTYYSYYRPRDDAERPSRFYDQAPSSSYIPAMDYTPDPVVPLPISVPVLLSSSDSEDDFTVTHSTLVSDRSGNYYSRQDTSNPVLDEYFKYKDASTLSYPLADFSVHVPPPAMAAEPFTSAVKPRSFYSRTGKSAIDDYDEADMNSFLAQRNARRTLLTPGRHLGQSLEPRRRSVSSMEAILTQSMGYSTGKGPAASHGGYKASQSVGILPASAYTGRWYPMSSVGLSSARRFNPTLGMTSYDVDDDVSEYYPISGHGMRSVGRTIATRVTPAPGYGPRSNYARSHSLTRY